MRRIATICAAAATTAVLAVPATASAETVKQKGQIVDDDETKVTLHMELNALGPIEVANFKAKNVFTRCDKEPTRINFTALDPIPVDGAGEFKARLTDNAGGFLRIAGKVKNDGLATVGTLKTNEIKSDDGTTCKTPKQKFKTSVQ